jgi:hypothetical protein
MRLPDDLLLLAAQRAERSGVTRTRYVEELIRRDLKKNGRTDTTPVRQVAAAPRVMEENDDIFG